MTMNVPGYAVLADILQRAYNQAAVGKGADRHANELPFDKQPMQTIADKHGVGFLLGQADKKTVEAHGMLRRGEVDKAVHELLGAINYTAGAILFAEGQPKAKAEHETADATAPAPTFKVGDKVRINPDLICAAYNASGGPGWDIGMGSTAGMVGTVTRGNPEIGFRVQTEDDSWWYFPADLELVKTPARDSKAEFEDAIKKALTSAFGPSAESIEIIEVASDAEEELFKILEALTKK